MAAAVLTRVPGHRRLAPARPPLPIEADPTLTIRPAASEDVEGLARLYDGLSSHDRHLRFFSAYHPPREFLASWAGIAERGGCCLVAVRSAPGGPGSVVADAGYLALPNGNGELAVTVARGERGGLGGVLVDALLDAAATRGVAALEAEVLLENEAMLRLVRARGAREVGRDGSYSVRMSLPSRPGVRESAARPPGRHSLDVRSASGRGASPVLRIG